MSRWAGMVADLLKRPRVQRRDDEGLEEEYLTVPGVPTWGMPSTPKTRSMQPNGCKVSLWRHLQEMPLFEARQKNSFGIGGDRGHHGESRVPREMDPSSEDACRFPDKGGCHQGKWSLSAPLEAWSPSHRQGGDGALEEAEGCKCEVPLPESQWEAFEAWSGRRRRCFSSSSLWCGVANRKLWQLIKRPATIHQGGCSLGHTMNCLVTWAPTFRRKSWRCRFVAPAL